jgi:hypothetical protein
MGESDGDGEQGKAEDDGALPDLKPWRQAGWIFRDGDCVAIERTGEEFDDRSQARVLAD